MDNVPEAIRSGATSINPFYTWPSQSRLLGWLFRLTASSRNIFRKLLHLIGSITGQTGSTFSSTGEGGPIENLQLSSADMTLPSNSFERIEGLQSNYLPTPGGNRETNLKKLFTRWCNKQYDGLNSCYRNIIYTQSVDENITDNSSFTNFDCPDNKNNSNSSNNCQIFKGNTSSEKSGRTVEKTNKLELYKHNYYYYRTRRRKLHCSQYHSIRKEAVLTLSRRLSIIIA